MTTPTTPLVATPRSPIVFARSVPTARQDGSGSPVTRSPTARPPDPLLGPGRLRTVPNLVTLVRTVLAVAIGAAGVARSDQVLLGVAYAVYWSGDIADGWVARRLGQETRAGAVFDIVSDRACTILLCAGLVTVLPEAWVVAAVFLVSFAVVDTMLSLAFLCWPLLGPNDFHVVDRLVWRLNWSPAAKAVNTAGVVVLVLLEAHTAALTLALVALALKVWSVRRVARLLP